MRRRRHSHLWPEMDVGSQCGVSHVLVYVWKKMCQLSCGSCDRGRAIHASRTVQPEDASLCQRTRSPAAAAARGPHLEEEAVLEYARRPAGRDVKEVRVGASHVGRAVELQWRG